jgi:hypothetical protein
MTDAKRPSPRPDPRVPSRADAERRAAEILSGVGDIDEATDEFFFDLRDVPDGWVYQWKRETIYGAEDPAYQTALARTGWAAVPTERHPNMMPAGGAHPSIRRKGMILMERPKMVDDHFRAMDDRRARNQVRAKEEQLAATPPGTLPRDADKRTAPKISKSYEPMPVPDSV